MCSATVVVTRPRLGNGGWPDARAAGRMGHGTMRALARGIERLRGEVDRPIAGVGMGVVYETIQPMVGASRLKRALTGLATGTAARRGNKPCQ